MELWVVGVFENLDLKLLQESKIKNLVLKILRWQKLDW